LKNIILGKLGLNIEIENKKTFIKRLRLKLEIKRIRTKVEIPTTKRIKL